MKVIVHDKFPGSEPYRMHGLSIEVLDIDLPEKSRKTIEKAIWSAVNIAVKQTIKYAYVRGLLSREAAQEELKRVGN